MLAFAELPAQLVFLHCVCACAVESNDSLYGGDAAYLAQVATFIETLVKETLSTLNEIGEAGDLMVSFSRFPAPVCECRSSLCPC